MNLNLTNKVFFITGSSKGIGFGIAKCFLQEGAHVVLTGRTLETLKKAEDALKAVSNNKILALSGDMQNPEILSSRIKNTFNLFGRLDGVIANIGSGREPLGLHEDHNIWQSSYDKNLKGNLLLVQAAVPYLKKEGGTITFISSICGIEDLNAPIAYSMNKAALNVASKKLSRELAPYSIRVNSIAPGNIFFPEGSWDTKLQAEPEKIQQYISTEVPLNCFGEPEDIGNICTFLASDKAKFITGSIIIADGGQTRSF